MEGIGGGATRGEGAPSRDNGSCIIGSLLALLGQGSTLDVLIEFKLISKLEDADIILPVERVVDIIDNLLHVDSLFSALVLKEIVLAGNNLDA